VADNVAITAGSGTTIATDESAGNVHYQVVKLADGTNAGTTQIPGSVNGLYVQGQVAADAAVAGNPVLLGGKALAFGTAVTAVNADADSVALLADRHGLLYVATYHPTSWVYAVSTGAALTDTEVAAAGGAGLCHYVTDIVFAASAAANVYFEEAAATVMGPFYLVGAGSFAISFKTPRKLTAATALTVTTSLAAAHSVEVHGFTAA
jgi:hypothetical protein